MRLVLRGKFGWNRGRIGYLQKHEGFWTYNHYLQEGKMKKLWNCEEGQSLGGVGEGVEEVFRRRLDTLSVTIVAKDQASDDLDADGSVVVVRLRWSKEEVMLPSSGVERAYGSSTLSAMPHSCNLIVNGKPQHFE